MDPNSRTENENEINVSTPVPVNNPSRSCLDPRGYFDVLVYPSPAPPAVAGLRPVESRLLLSDEIWVGPLVHAQADEIMQMCEPHAYNDRGRSFHLYALVRKLDACSWPRAWDHDEKLRSALAFSRLIHPTSISFQYAATVRTGSQGELLDVEPGPVSGPGSRAWVAEPSRDYLLPQDIAAIGALLAASSREVLPSRIRTAFWYHEYAAWHYEASVRWMLISTGLESLVHVHREKPPYATTRQFTERVPLLAGEVGRRIGKDHAVNMYELRSLLSHGGLHSAVFEEHRPLYCAMESLLRTAIQKAIVEPSFADIFKDDSAIEKRWPVR